MSSSNSHPLKVRVYNTEKEKITDMMLSSPPRIGEKIHINRKRYETKETKFFGMYSKKEAIREECFYEVVDVIWKKPANMKMKYVYVIVEEIVELDYI